jgi:hypothetical protein
MSQRASDRVTRDDLEDALRSFQGGVADEVQSRKQQILIGAGVAAVLVLALTYFIGKRRGRRKSTFVEIRRF